MNDILNKIPPMLTGVELEQTLRVLPQYTDGIRTRPAAERLLALNSIFDTYIPNKMGMEIYTKIYLSLVRSLQNKALKVSIEQRNINAQALQNNTFTPCGGINGQDTFSIIGESGIGKSTAINRSIEIMNGRNVIITNQPHCKIIPALFVQCPFDCSAKTLLLDINRKIDSNIGTSYYDMYIKARSSTNQILIGTAQALLNHVAVLIIDEIQNLIKHRAGNQLIMLITELLNESKTSIVMVGTPESEMFFSSVEYFSRRTLGLRYGRYNYDLQFHDFCKCIWSYQYTATYVDINEGFINYLYQHSAGTLAHVIFLFATAQEVAILNGSEKLSFENLDEAYRRMHTLHHFIQPEADLRKKPSKRKKVSSSTEIINNIEPVSDSPVSGSEATIVQHAVNASVEAWTFTDLAKKSKGYDMLELLKGKVSITEV